MKALLCAIRRAFGKDHAWRRAHKHENHSLKYCRLCSRTRLVRRRAHVS